METRYKIVYTGELLPEFEHEDVVSNLISISNMDREKAGKFLSVTKPTLIKKGLDKEKAQKFYTLFKKAGLQIKVLTSQSTTSSTLPTPPVDKPHEATSLDNTLQAAETKPVRTPRPNTTSDNPYASPKADLEVNTTQSEEWLEKPQKVSASHGWLWIKEAATMFLAQPWKWTAMAVVAGIILFAVNFTPALVFLAPVPVEMFPVFGLVANIVISVLNSILSILIGGGLMMAAQRQATGEPLLFSYLFKGFSHNRNQLIMISLLYLSSFLIVGLVMALFIGTSILAMLGVGAGDPEAAVNAMAANIPMFIIAMLVGMALSIPLMMAFWFSTPLVAITDRKAWTAYKLSLRACLTNWLPFLVYGLAFFILGLILIAAMTALSGLMAFFASSNGSIILAFLPILIFILIGIPLSIIGGLSIFTSFKDIFYKTA